MNYVIRLSHFIDQPFELLGLDDSGAVVERRWCEKLSELDNLASAKQLIVLLPGQSVSLVPTELPKMNAAELQEAIPYAVEDRIANDVEDLYFVKAGDIEQGAVIAGIDRSQFLELFHLLKKTSLNIAAMLPDCLALPLQENHWSLAFVDDAVLWRYGAQLGVSFDSDQFALCWPMILKQHAEELPAVIDVYGDEKQQGALFKQSELPEMVWHDADQWLDGKKLIKQVPMNLLQGKFRLYTRLSRIKKRWLQCGAVAVLGFVLMFSMNATGYLYMHHQNKAVLAQIDQYMTRAGLSGESPGDARSLITEQINHYKSLQKANTFIELLQRIAPVVHGDPHWSTAGVDYSKGRLNLMLKEVGAGSIQGLMSQLRNRGLKVSQLSGRDKNDNVTLVIESGT